MNTVHKWNRHNGYVYQFYSTYMDISDSSRYSEYDGPEAAYMNDSINGYSKERGNFRKD